MGSGRLNLLLDTHIWLWSLVEPEQLTSTIFHALTDEANQLWLSPISVWEFLLLAERPACAAAWLAGCRRPQTPGRVRIQHGVAPPDWVEAALLRVPMHEAPLTREVAVRSRAVRVAHEDPADRFLAATAAVYDLTLVTADERLLSGKGFRTLANR